MIKTLILKHVSLRNIRAEHGLFVFMTDWSCNINRAYKKRWSICSRLGRFSIARFHDRYFSSWHVIEGLINGEWSKHVSASLTPSWMIDEPRQIGVLHILSCSYYIYYSTHCGFSDFAFEQTIPPLTTKYRGA